MPTCDCGAEILTGCTCRFKDSPTITWEGLGVAANTAKPTVVIDPAADNAMECGVSGLKAIATSRYVAVPRCRIRHASIQTLNATAEAIVSMTTVVYDTDNMSSVASAITIKTAGIYEVGCNVVLTAEGVVDAGSHSLIQLDKNEFQFTLAESLDPLHIGTLAASGVSVSVVAPLQVGDTLRILGRHDSAGETIQIASVADCTPVLYATFLGDLP